LESKRARVLARLKRNPVVGDLLVVLAFCAFTSVLTWPYINYLRDVVADPGDPYLVSWIIWWDYHQTFTDPLNLFHSTLFYPFRYTLAFSEHSYGIALVFFPLFGLGFRPLTVHAVAIFFGFALSGYGAFRLARTLTGSNAAAWVTGIIFAFVPFRFHLLSHLLYLFSPWIPLQFEALLLFVRARSRKRAAWLGFAFFMSGLTSISWFALGLVPFALAAAILLTRYRLWRERAFWLRGAIAVTLAAIALLPFMLPYYFVSKLYGFKRSIDEVKANSAWPIHWLSVEARNKLWSGMGANLPDGYRFKLFPGLLPILLSLAAVVLGERKQIATATAPPALPPRTRWLPWLDIAIVVLLVLSLLAVGFEGSDAFHKLFQHLASEHALALLTAALIARLCLAYPPFLRRGENANLIETLCSERHSDAFWLGSLLTLVGFCYSLGWNFFFYRICYDLIVMFRSMRVPPRGSMFAYLGLALLAGLGTKRLAALIHERQPSLPGNAVVVATCALLLFELNGAPLRIMRGDVFPDAVTLRLKQTPMRGGLVVLPAGGDFNHRHILRSADHQKPLIVGTSGFNSPYEDQIEAFTRQGAIADDFMTLLEKIPASYVVVENHLIAPERRPDYDTFLARAVVAGRLRYVNRFDGRDDLYAVVTTEPQARTEAPMPFALELKDWAALLNEDPVNVLGDNREWSQKLYRFYLVSYGALPRYAEFLADVKVIGRGVVADSADQQTRLETNLNEFAVDWVGRTKFRELYQALSNERYLDTLCEHAGITLAAAERAALIEQLNGGGLTRAQALLALVDNRELVRKEENRSLVLLHYFGYLRRNPDDPPDKNLDGFNYWVSELERSGEIGRLPRAFRASGEYEGIESHSKQKPDR
jgi:hypothetical protein